MCGAVHRIGVKSMTVYDLLNAVTSGNLDHSLRCIHGSGEVEYLRRRAQIISGAEQFSRLYPLRNDVRVYFAPDNADISLDIGDMHISAADSRNVAVIVDFHGGDEINISAGELCGKITLPTCENEGDLGAMLSELCTEIPDVTGFDMVLDSGGEPLGALEIRHAVRAVLCSRFGSESEFQKVDLRLFFAGYSLCVTDISSAEPIDYSLCELPDGIVSEDDFYTRLPELAAKSDSSRILDISRYFAEKRRSTLIGEAIVNGDITEFFRLADQTSDSCPEVGAALLLSSRLISGDGATIVGKGCIQAFVPTYTAAGYVGEMERIYGEGSCRSLVIGSTGAVEICG